MASDVGGVFCCGNDPEWTLLEADDNLYHFLGRSSKELEEECGGGLFRVIHPEDRSALRASFKEQLKEGPVVFGECRLMRRDNTVCWVRISARQMRIDASNVYFYCIYHDISEQIEAQRRLALSESRYDTVMRLTQDIIFEWDCNTGNIFYSTNFKEKFGYQPPEGNYPDCLLASGLVPEEDGAAVKESIDKLYAGGTGIEVEHRIRKNDGTYLWVKVRVTAICDKDGRMLRILGVISDIQQQKQTVLEAKREASLDSLTGLYNRRSTEQLVDEYLKKEAAPAAFLVIDVDNFKGVNDTLGHSYGDAVLSDVSEQLKGLFRNSDVVGRVGGDEFAVLLKHVSGKEEIRRKADGILEIFHREREAHGSRYEITGSIGVSFYPEDGSTYLELFKKADAAMYYSKNNGKNCCTFFDRSFMQKAQALENPSFDTVKVQPQNFREHIIEYLFRILLENPDVEKAIPALMDLLGNFYRLDRISVYESTEDGSRLRCTFEWCREGVSSMKKRHALIESRRPPGEMEPVEKTESYFIGCPDTSLLEDEEARNWFEERGTRSSLLCPVLEDGRTAVLAGFEVCFAPRIPDASQRSTLALASEAIGLVLLRARKQEQLQSMARQRVDLEKINFLYRNIPGGMLGGYVEEGFPLYYINARLLQYLGYASQEEYEKATHGLALNGVYREDRERVQKDVEAQIRATGEYEVLHRMDKKDGSYLWVQNFGKIIETESGRRAVICLCIDVTEQVALKNQLDLYRKAARGGAFTIRMDEELTLLYGNDIFYDLHGYTKKTMETELESKSSRLISPEDLSRVKRTLWDAFEAGETGTQWEMQVITRQGKTRGILVTGTFEYQGPELVLNGFITDLTEVLALQEQIARKEQLYRTALRQTNVSVWEFDAQTHSIHMTENAQMRHAYSGIVENVPESLIADGHIHPSCQEEFRSLYRRLRQGEERVQADILTRTPDREGWWWERITYTTLFDRNGKPVRAVGVGEDITRQKEAELKYQKELEMRQAFSEGLLVSARINLTKNRVDMLIERDDPEAPPAEGISLEALLDMEAAVTANPNDRKRCRSTFSRGSLLLLFEKGKKSVSIEYRRKEPDGRLIWVNTTVRLAKDATSGDIYAYAGIRDIDTQKMLELALLQRAEKDPLTDTYRKETAGQMMQEALMLARREKRVPALLIFEVEHFSLLISRSGYAAAEQVLRELSELLHTRFGKDQIVGRFYGDELVLFLTSAPDRVRLCALAQEICRTMERSEELTAAEGAVRLLVGAAYAEKHTESFEALYRQAMSALEAVRQTDPDGCVAVYAGGQRDLEAWGPAAGQETDRENVGSDDARDILLRCALVLASDWKFSKAAEPVLKDIADYYSAQRAWLFLEPESFRPAAFWEWKRDGVPSRQDLAELAKRKQPSGAEAFRAAAQEPGEENAFLLPLEEDNKILGFLGVDVPARNRERRTLLETVRQLLAKEAGNRRFKQKQEYLKYHDEMTGLLNRDSFQEFSSLLREESLISLGVVSVDINGLKRLNNRYGVAFGDSVVRSTAVNLEDAFAGGKIYRFAGDEFLVLCENLTQENFLKRNAGFVERMEGVYPSCISTGSIWADQDINLEDMISHADERMLVAKQEYYRNLDTLTKGYDPLLLRELQEDIQKGCYHMFLQPKAQIGTGKITGAEALVRYRNPGGAIIGPDKFVPGLEREGLIRYIDLFIFEEVCRALRDWEDRGLPLITVSLNFSRATLLEEKLIETMEKIRRRYQVEASLLEIEITESSGVLEQDVLARIGSQIRQQGYRLSLDDFGAKFSNIATLSVMELNVLKLDKSLVNDLISNEEMTVIVRNFLITCRELGIESVAEGVETVEQLQILQELECDYAQGYLFNKPIPRQDFERLYLEEHIE